MFGVVARLALGVAFSASAGQTIIATRPPGDLRVQFSDRGALTVFDTRLDVPKAHVFVTHDGDTVTVTVI